MSSTCRFCGWTLDHPFGCSNPRCVGFAPTSADIQARGLKEGQKLRGICGRLFSEPLYLEATIEAVGADWVVVRSGNGDPDFAYDPDVHSKLRPFLVEDGAAKKGVSNEVQQ